MLSRRLLRIKVMQLLYAFFQKEDKDLQVAEKELVHSIRKAYDLYHYLLLLVLDIAAYAEDRIEISRNKLQPTSEELNPNQRFVNNRILVQLRANKALTAYLNNQKYSWVQYPEIIKKIYSQLRDSEEYARYMNGPDPDYKADKEFMCLIYSSFIATSEDMFAALEEQSIYWNDDVEFIISMILKTFEKFREGDPEGGKMMRLYKNEEDEEFAKILFRKTILRHEESSLVIAKYTRNWETDRLAFMDLLLMEMAIVEMLDLPHVPVKVSLNEYIEMSKYYSTDKSSVFINGVLDKVVAHYRENGDMQKSGRGLIGDNPS